MQKYPELFTLKKFYKADKYFITLNELVNSYIRQKCLEGKNKVTIEELEEAIRNAILEGKLVASLEPVLDKCIDVIRTKLYLLLDEYAKEGTIELNKGSIILHCEKLGKA